MATDKKRINTAEILSNGSFSIDGPANVGEVLRGVVEEQKSVVVTLGGKMAALILPMTAPEVLEQYLALHPDVAEQITAADAAYRNGELQGIPVDELLASGAFDPRPTHEPISGAFIE